MAGVLLALALAPCSSGGGTTPPVVTHPPPFEAECAPVEGSVGTRENGYQGIWYMNQPQADEYRYKYSGGLATYPQQHVPLAVYVPAVHRTFFVYGGRAPGRDRVRNVISFYDHATGRVPRPVSVQERSTNNAHFNPTLAVDRSGYLYVFANIHGGYTALSHIYRSTCPYSISAFTPVRTDTFSYSQVWTTDQGMVWLHTRYGQYNWRFLWWSTSPDGITWTPPRQLTRMPRGNYQISWAEGDRVGTAFDYHPRRTGLNGRTNLYYVESLDHGATWRTVQGRTVATPMTGIRDNPALVRDYEAERLLVYLKDMKFDARGRPIILYLTSRGYEAGPQGGPRVWRTARWTGTEWEFRVVGESDHNYDHGSLYVEADGSWRVIAPLDAGPQPYMTGGDIVALRSTDEGQTWRREHTLAAAPGRPYTYVRGPVNAHPGFYAMWADGNAADPSTSDIMFATADGRAFRLPTRMTEEAMRPSAVIDAGGN